MLFVHRKFDADRLSKKKVIQKIKWTTFVDFGYHLGLKLETNMIHIKQVKNNLSISASLYVTLVLLNGHTDFK